MLLRKIKEKKKKEKTDLCVWVSPGFPRDLKNNDVTAIENGDDDQKHKKQETDEKHHGLDHHSCEEKAQGNKYIHQYTVPFLTNNMF